MGDKARDKTRDKVKNKAGDLETMRRRKWETTSGGRKSETKSDRVGNKMGKKSGKGETKAKQRGKQRGKQGETKGKQSGTLEVKEGDKEENKVGEAVGDKEINFGNAGRGGFSNGGAHYAEIDQYKYLINVKLLFGQVHYVLPFADPRCNFGGRCRNS